MSKRLTILFFICSLTGHAATLYVATNGSNANPGTIGSPWLTIQWAADHAAAGDTVLVQPGRYPETVRCETGASNITFQANGGIPWTRNGSNGIPSAASTWVKPDAFDIRKSGITVDGFVFADQTKYGEIVRFTSVAHNGKLLNSYFTNYQSIVGQPTCIAGRIVQASGSGAPTNAASGCILSNNWITHFGAAPVFLVAGISNYIRSNIVEITQTGTDCFRPWGQSNYLWGNIFRYNGAWGGPNIDHPDFLQTFGNGGAPECHEIFVLGNFCYDNDAQLCQISEDGGNIHDIYFINNVFVKFTGAANSGCNHMLWVNNLFWRVNQNSDNCMATRNTNDIYGTSIGTRWLNNAWLECGANYANTKAGWYRMYQELAPFVEAHHDYVAGSNYVAKAAAPPDDYGHWAAWGKENISVNGGNPQFVNRDGYDFHLLSTSPLLTAGTNASAITGITVDIEGTPFGSQWPIGPFASTNSAPPPPSNLKITINRRLRL